MPDLILVELGPVEPALIFVEVVATKSYGRKWCTDELSCAVCLC